MHLTFLGHPHRLYIYVCFIKIMSPKVRQIMSVQYYLHCITYWDYIFGKIIIIISSFLRDLKTKSHIKFQSVMLGIYSFILKITIFTINWGNSDDKKLIYDKKRQKSQWSWVPKFVKEACKPMYIYKEVESLMCVTTLFYLKYIEKLKIIPLLP